MAVRVAVTPLGKLMVHSSIYEDLPEDPESAFLLLENAFREECDYKIASRERNDTSVDTYAQYVTRVITVIQSLEINTGYDFSSLLDENNITLKSYLVFRRIIENLTIKWNINRVRHSKKFSVVLDESTKTSIRALLEKIKQAIGKLEVSDEKREALYSRVYALEAELNRNRTRLEVIGALWVETCGKVGEGVERLEPVRKWIDSIGNLIGVAKHEEGSPSSPRIAATPQPKQIEDQRSQSERDSSDNA